MKRPSLSILVLALIVTSLLLYANRARPTLLSEVSMPYESPVESLALNLNDNAISVVSGGAAASMVAPMAALSAEVAAAPAAQAVAGEITSAGLQRKVIGRAALELVVEDAAVVVTQINQLMEISGGYVANANLVHKNYNGVERLQGTLSLRVPAAQLDAVLAKLEKMGVEARAKSLSREDVTDQYTDIDAQLRNLQATEDELRELVAEVRKKPNARPDDILTVHRSMTDIRGQIDQLQGRKNMLNNLVGLATIDVTLTPHVVNLAEVKPEVKVEWQPLVVVRSAFHDLVGTLQGFIDVAIWLTIYFLPVMVMICIPVALIYFVARTLLTRWQRRSIATSVGN